MRKLTVLDYLEETESYYSDKAAMIVEERKYTYLELKKQARVIGYGISDVCKGMRRKPILLFMEKGFECFSAMFGVLYSGNIYVPMDIKTPIERLNHIIEVLESDYILTTDKEKAILNKIGYVGKIIIYQELIDKYSNSVNEDLLWSIRKDVLDADIMYILFTSGSTGVPKGVAVMHRSVMDYIDAFVDDTPISSDDIVGNQTPFYADMSLKDTYMSVAVGATICIIPQIFFMTPKKLLSYIDENNVSMIMWVPTAYRLISQFDGLSKVKPRNLKKFVFSGEAMPISVYSYWVNYYPLGECEYIQQYGPTEITGACTSFHVNRDYDDTERIPIGKPFRNTGILLMGEDGNVVTEAEIEGEICVYGTCLASGYYNNNECTREAFVQNLRISEYPSLMYKTGDIAKYDSEHNLIFISRKDFQIKHGGKRIELGEVESAVQKNRKIKACCCVHISIKDELVLFYTGDIEEKEIKGFLGESLPKYMIPTKYYRLEELPMLPNGKLDRKQLQLVAERD